MLEIKIPQLSESVSEATLVSWHRRAGEYVHRDETLADLETDKVVLELPAPADGLLTEVLVAAGAVVQAGQLVARMEEKAKASPSEQAPAREILPSAGQTAEPALSPSVRKLVAEHGLKPETIPGTGPRGRITKADVLDRLAQAPVDAEGGELSRVLGARPEERVPMTRLRSRIAERLLAVQAEAAILTTFNEVNLQAIQDLRGRHKERFEKEHGARLGFMSFFVKAVVAALKRFPVINASVDGSDIVYHGYFDIGVAIASDRGLVVPILRNADQLSIADIETGIAEFARKARDGKLTMEELSGGTFSITNGGVFGSMMSTPILNPPQSAILGMHAVKERPVAEKGQVVIRPMMYLALSYDHRIIDGKEAVQFLVAVRDALEDPSRLLLDI